MNRDTFPQRMEEKICYAVCHIVSLISSSIVGNLFKTNKKVKKLYLCPLIFKNTIVTFSIIKFPGKRSVSVFPQISISWIQFMNISPSKAGQKSKFIIQGIISSYLSRSPRCTYITNGIPIAPFFWRKSTYPSKEGRKRLLISPLARFWENEDQRGVGESFHFQWLG